MLHNFVHGYKRILYTLVFVMLQIDGQQDLTSNMLHRLSQSLQTVGAKLAMQCSKLQV